MKSLKKMRKLIFLDVDGVLNNAFLPQNPERNIIPELKNIVGIDKRLLENFRLIKDAHPDLEVVLSSTWRLSPTHTTFVSLAFERAGIPFDLIGRTPQKMSGHRGREIELWLDQNIHEPAKVVAIDDDISAGSLCPGPHKFFYAQTLWIEGLTSSKAQEIINFLEYGNHLGMRI